MKRLQFLKRGGYLLLIFRVIDSAKRHIRIFARLFPCHPHAFERDRLGNEQIGRRLTPYRVDHMGKSCHAHRLERIAKS